MIVQLHDRATLKGTARKDELTGYLCYPCDPWLKNCKHAASSPVVDQRASWLATCSRVQVCP